MTTPPGDDQILAIERVEAELLPIIRTTPWTRAMLDALKRQLQFTSDIHAGYEDHSLRSSAYPTGARDPAYLVGPPGERETETAYNDRVSRITEKLEQHDPQPTPLHANKRRSPDG
jgi:hypothetical protein